MAGPGNCVWTFSTVDNLWHPVCNCSPGSQPGLDPNSKSGPLPVNASTMVNLVTNYKTAHPGATLTVSSSPSNGDTLTVPCEPVPGGGS